MAVLNGRFRINSCNPAIHNNTLHRLESHTVSIDIRLLSGMIIPMSWYTVSLISGILSLSCTCILPLFSLLFHFVLLYDQVY